VARRVGAGRYDRRVSTEPEVVDGLPVLSEPAAIAPTPAGNAVGPVAVQAAAAAGAGLLAGMSVIAVLRGRRARRSSRALRIGRGRRGRRLDVVGTRSFLVDVHLLDRR
jgi:hypothetical protein